MCPVEKVAACELSFLPIQSDSYGDDVRRVISLIEESGLEYTVGEMSTLVRGNSGSVFALLNRIYDSLDETCSFEMVVKISNLCGCKLKR
ncbi:MAG TPA: hypothetical protein GX691_05680 [Clostridia bacterium]|jgi:uncharacterized protein YqgV (UPF0045/DUF77 family)|nr:hypothetical protein [Clostridia bacterium]